MDALSDVLRAANLTGGVFLNASFTAPWCLASQITPDVLPPTVGRASEIIAYHYVVDGELRIRLMEDKSEGILVKAGEIVLVPRNDLHLIGSDLRVRPVAADQVLCAPEGTGLFTARHGGGGPGTQIICGFLGYGGVFSNPVIAALPAILKLAAEEIGSSEWIRSTFQFAAAEVAAGRPGSATVLAKISELLFAEAVRRHVERMSDSQTGWLAGRCCRFRL